MLHFAQLRCRHPKNSSKTQGLPIAHGYSPAKDFSFFSIANREACNWIRRKKFYTCSIGGNFVIVSSSFFAISSGMEVALRAPPRLTATLRNEEATLVIAKIAVDTSPAAAVAMEAAIEDMEHLIEAMGLHLIEATDPHRSVQGLDMGPRQIGPTQQDPTPLEVCWTFLILDCCFTSEKGGKPAHLCLFYICHAE